MQSKLDELIASKRITSSVVEYARAQNYADADLIALAERQRALKAKIALDGAPTTYRAPAPITNPNDPTPQWQAKAGKLLHSHAVGRGEVVPVKQFRVRNVVDQYAEKFGMDMRSALVRFMQDADYHERCRVADLNGSGGGSSGDRLGGLGNVPQHVRDGHHRHAWIWKQLSPELRLTGRALVLREMSKPDGTPFSMEEFGGHIIPSTIDKNRRWGIAAGALWALAGGLVALYAVCPVKVRRLDESERALEAIKVLSQ